MNPTLAWRFTIRTAAAGDGGELVWPRRLRRSGAHEMPHAKDWTRYRGFGCPRAPIQTVYGIDRCSWASEPSTDIVSCQAFCTRRRFSSRLLTRWNQAEPRLDTAGQRAQPGGSRLGRDTQSAQVLFDGASKKP